MNMLEFGEGKIPGRRKTELGERRRTLESLVEKLEEIDPKSDRALGRLRALHDDLTSVTKRLKER